MDSNERNKFIEFFCQNEIEILAEMREFARENYVPIIRTEMKQFFETLLFIHKPKRILEIGTAIGYSSLMMCFSMEKYVENNDCEIVSIERNQEMYIKAIENIKKANKDHIIKVKLGEAESILEDLVKEHQEFDMIFMDAAKGQYLTFLPSCMLLLKVDGLLISDNVLQGGDVTKSRFSVPRRQRTIHQRMREYLWEINHRDDLKTAILDIADGATVSIKLKC